MSARNFYAIQHIPSGDLLSISVSGVEGSEEGFSGTYTAELERPYGDAPHLFAHRQQAERVLTENTDWYNSDLTAPILDRALAAECQVVEIGINFN